MVKIKKSVNKDNMSWWEPREICEIIEIVENQWRLQEFVYCLYRNEKYNLNKLKSMDALNRGVAIQILEEIYPNNVFGDLDRFS